MNYVGPLILPAVADSFFREIVLFRSLVQEIHNFVQSSSNDKNTFSVAKVLMETYKYSVSNNQKVTA